MTYPCGCVNEVDAATGILKSVSKCQKHKSQAGRGGRAYYEELGAIKDGCPQSFQYKLELADALDEMDDRLEPADGSSAIEIGCGVGGYIPMLLQLGYQYTGFELDNWAAAYCRRAFCVRVQSGLFECADLSSERTGPVSLVLVAHVLEHVTDVVFVLKRVLDALLPNGRLVLIVPDDTDPVNPDHLWFFNQQNLTALLTSVGFVNIKSIVRQVVAHEKFMYFSAYKPE